MIGKRSIVRRSAEDIKSFPHGGHERRLHQRYQGHKIVSYIHGQKHLLTLAVDLGMGGMKIKTDYTLPKNERLRFTMVLGNGSISSKGRIVYSRTLSGGQHVSGIQFLGLSRRDSALLRTYLTAVKE